MTRRSVIAEDAEDGSAGVVTEAAPAIHRTEDGWRGLLEEGSTSSSLLKLLGDSRNVSKERGTRAGQPALCRLW